MDGSTQAPKIDNAATSTAAPARAMRPVGLNHLVLNVRDQAESHRFWTEVLGFQQVGELKATPTRPNPPKMRFYSGSRDGGTHHHDVALVENKDLPPPPEVWSMFGGGSPINHIAITYPDRETWMAQLRFMRAKGVKFGRRVNHGMTHSLYVSDPNGYGVELLYDLPREIWQDDIDGALNYVEVLPTEGEEAFEDRIEGLKAFPKPA